MKPVMKRIYKVLAVLAAVYVLALAFFFWAMHEPERFGRVMKRLPEPVMIAAFVTLPFESMWNAARGGALEVGAPAPDFQLQTTDKKFTVQLSVARGQKPVVLVFGSYT